MDANITVLLFFSLLFPVAVLFITLALSKLVIPRYETSISEMPVDTPTHPGHGLPETPPPPAADVDDIDLPHLGGRSAEGTFAQTEDALSAIDPYQIDIPGPPGSRALIEPPEVIEEAITAKYLISYAKWIYLNQLFWLRVEIGAPGASLTADSGRREAARGSLRFIHRWFQKKDEPRHPLPEMRVELKYDRDEFRVTNPVKVKPLPQSGKVAYDFAVKSLKSEDSVLTVEIAYVGSKWQPRQVTMLELTGDSGYTTTTTKLSPSSIAEEIVILAREELTIETKSFLNMNATSLNIFSKGMAVLLTAIYIGLIIRFGLTEDTLTTLIVGLSSIVSALGIPIAGNLWRDAQVEQEKAVVG